MVSFAVEKAFNINYIPFVYFFFCFLCLRRQIQKLLLLLMSTNVLLKLPSRNFTVSGLTFRSLIHFEFIFVYGVRKCSNFMLLNVAVQFYPSPLIEEIFSIVYSCLLCHRLIDHKCMCSFLGSLFYSINLYVCFVPVSYCLDYYNFVVMSEVKKHDMSNSVLFS